MSDDVEHLMTVEDIADILRVSRMTVYRLVRRGDLTALRIGHMYRFRVSDLNDYLVGGST